MSERKFKELPKQKLKRMRGGTNGLPQCCAHICDLA